jgi:transposase
MFQFVEDLSDRQTADAVRARIDWKYALGLDLDNPGFDHTVLTEFRSRLIDGDAERLLFDLMLERFRQLGLLRAHGQQRTDSSHVLAAARALSRLELVHETLRHVLDVLGTAVPAWMLAHARPDWVERYRRTDEVRLPKSKEAQLELAGMIGADGSSTAGGHLSSGCAAPVAESAGGREAAACLVAELPVHRGRRALADD